MGVVMVGSYTQKRREQEQKRREEEQRQIAEAGDSFRLTPSDFTPLYGIGNYEQRSLPFDPRVRLRTNVLKVYNAALAFGLGAAIYGTYNMASSEVGLVRSGLESLLR